MSFIYKYETSTLTCFGKAGNVLNLALQNIFYEQLCVESTFTYNLGSTIRFQTGVDAIWYSKKTTFYWKRKCKNKKVFLKFVGSCRCCYCCSCCCRSKSCTTCRKTVGPKKYRTSVAWWLQLSWANCLIALQHLVNFWVLSPLPFVI